MWPKAFEIFLKLRAEVSQQKVIRFLILACVLPWVIALASKANAEMPLAERAAKYKDSTVFITAEITNQDGRSVNLFYGSGVIVSNSGYILTVLHIVERATNEGETLTFYLSRGSRNAAPVRAVIVDTLPDADLMLLQAPSNFSAEPIPICPTSPKVGDQLIAFGFPLDREFSAVQGQFTNSDGEDGRWLSTLPLDPGMSGGPVISADGTLVGIAHGGEFYNPKGLEVPAPRMTFVTPVDKAYALLLDFGIESECPMPPIPNSPAPDTIRFSYDIHEVASPSQTRPQAQEASKGDPSAIFKSVVQYRKVSFTARPGYLFRYFDIVDTSSNRGWVKGAVITPDRRHVELSIQLEVRPFDVRVWYFGSLNTVQSACPPGC